MSLGDRLDRDPGVLDTNTKNPNGITRCLSIMVNEDQHQGNWNKIREISSIPGGSLCGFSQWVEQSAREIFILNGGEGRSTRFRSLTDRALAYKNEKFSERRRKFSRRLTRKYIITEDLLFCIKNIILVEGEMNQLNEIFKMLLVVRHEYNEFLGHDERNRDDDWFDEVYPRVCFFKRKVHCWLREAAQKAKSSNCSSRNSKHVSDKGSMDVKKSNLHG